MLDPRQVFLSPFVYSLDPATLALLSAAPQQTAGGGKLLGAPSFRISDILDSAAHDDKANTSGENDSDHSESSQRSVSVDSARTLDASKKTRKARTIFTDKQLQELEATFEKHKYLNVQDRMDLAQKMGLTDTQVKTWYQNRRTKWKRQSTAGAELLNDAANLQAVQQLLRTNSYWANVLPPASWLAISGLGPMTVPMPSSMPHQAASSCSTPSPPVLIQQTSKSNEK